MAIRLRLVGQPYRARLITALLRGGLDVRLFTVAAVGVLALTIRGSSGSPTPAEIQDSLSSPGTTFETSQERSRWAVILALYNHRTFAIDGLAVVATPDLVSAKGHFYSSLAPGVSVAAVPLYALGTELRASQLFVFSMQAALLLATMLLMFWLSRVFQLGRRAALFAAVTFGFATNAWGYSVTLSGYPPASLLLLAGCCLACAGPYLRVRQFLGLWLLYGIAVLMENSSFFTFIPLVIGAATRLYCPAELRLKERRPRPVMMFRSIGLALSPLSFLTILLLYGWYNTVLFGSPLTLSSALPRLSTVGSANPTPVAGVSLTPPLDLTPHGILSGLSTLLVSTDRGLLFYAPIVLLAVFGWQALAKRPFCFRAALGVVPLMAIAIHAPLQDPYGGWAFGPRYLIPALPELCLLTGLGLQRFAHTEEMKLVYSAAFTYSVAVSSLAPLTTNAIPPSVEAPGVLKSSYLATFSFLSRNHLSSGLYNAIFGRVLSGWEYYLLVLLPVLIGGWYLIWTCSRDVIPRTQQIGETSPSFLFERLRGKEV
jgi:hypothetical protein